MLVAIVAVFKAQELLQDFLPGLMQQRVETLISIHSGLKYFKTS